MRVLVITAMYRGGGAERCSRDLFHHLRGNGVEVDMLVARREPDDPPGVAGTRLAGEKYLRALEWFYRPIHWRFPGSVFALSKARAARYDLVHLHNVGGGWLSLPTLRRLSERIPAVWTLHDEWAPNGGVPYDLSRVMPVAEIDQRFGPDRMLHPGGRVAARERRYVTRNIPRAAAIISPSSYIARLASNADHLRGATIHQIPYGVELLEHPARGMARAEARRRFGLSEDAKVVLLLAASLNSPYKGPWLAREVLSLLGDDEASVLVVGRGGAQITQATRQRVVAPGFLADPDSLAAAYRAADLMLLPSVADNMPYVALESMACGIPIVGFSVGGVSELIGEDERGILAPPLDTRSLADAVRRLLADSELARRLGQAGREWVEANCRMEHFIRANLSVYEEVLSTRREENGVLARVASAPHSQERLVPET